MVNNKEYMQYEGGSMKVYTGPKGGKFVINKKGKKVYLDRNVNARVCVQSDLSGCVQASV